LYFPKFCCLFCIAFGVAITLVSVGLVWLISLGGLDGPASLRAPDVFWTVWFVALGWSLKQQMHTISVCQKK
jgi:hypothetical protein